MSAAAPTWWERFKAWIKAMTIPGAVSALVIIVVSPFLLVSEASIKNYIESWLSGCLFVLEKEQVRGNRVMVRGYLSGKPPKELPITFSVTGATINRIQMINPVEAGARSDSLALHPQTYWACPGTFCEQFGRDATAPKLTITLSDLDPDFPYAFYVDFDTDTADKDLKLFVQFDPGLAAGICRVEGANLFNLFVRLTKLQKFWVLVFVFLVAWIILAILKRPGGEKP
jgi:hypothetical protein